MHAGMHISGRWLPLRFLYPRRSRIHGLRGGLACGGLGLPGMLIDGAGRRSGRGHMRRVGAMRPGCTGGYIGDGGSADEVFVRDRVGNVADDRLSGLSVPALKFAFAAATPPSFPRLRSSVVAQPEYTSADQSRMRSQLRFDLVHCLSSENTVAVRSIAGKVVPNAATWHGLHEFLAEFAVSRDQRDAHRWRRFSPAKRHTCPNAHRNP